MKRLLLAGPLLGIGAVSALAADMAAVPLVKAPPVVVNSWAGFYLGAHGGYGWGNNDFLNIIQTASSIEIGGLRSKGAIWGGQAGYNWQFGRVVAGVELDFSGANINGSSVTSLSIPGPPTLTLSLSYADRIKYLGTARARLGWTPVDSVLLYGTAGLGWERVDRTQTATESAVLNGSLFSLARSLQAPSDRFGWVAGAGAEVGLGNSNWVGRLEYLHYDFGTTQNTTSIVTATPGGTAIDQGGRQTIEAVRAGLSYRFGVLGPAPGVGYAKALDAKALGAKAPAAVVPASWAGFYLGVHGGYGWGDDNFSRAVGGLSPEPTFFGGVRSTGWIAGGQVGHNWQFDRVVAGLELDLSGTGIEGNSSPSSIPFGAGTETVQITDKVKYLGTARGRVGWLPTDNILLYGTAGLAWERIEQTTTTVDAATFTSTGISTDPFDHFGWVAGIGAESLLFGTNWVGRLEYLHYDFGKVTAIGSLDVNIPGTFFSTAESSGHQTIDVVRAGMSYKFGDPAPVPVVSYAKAPRMAPPSNWAGFYLGAHGGYGWMDNDFSFDYGGGQRTNGIKSRGWLAGGQAGYNWQFGRVVAGLEADYSLTGIKGVSDPRVSNAGNTIDTLPDDLKYLGTARGRLGCLPRENVLLYGTAGLAWERINRSSTTVDLGPPPSTTRQTTPSDYFGWVVGVGAETLLWNSNWIGRLEYLHYDFGSIESLFSSSSTDPTVASVADRGGRQTIEVVRAGVSYKFNGDGPLVARY